jgi:uncharacterized membrane protein YccC
LEQAESWFGGRMADRLIRLSRYSQTLPVERRTHWDDGLLGLDLGDELLELRASLTNIQGSLGIERDRYLRQLAAALGQGGPSKANASLLDEPSAALLEALEQPLVLAEQDREMARAAVLQLRFTWQKWCRRGSDSTDGL